MYIPSPKTHGWLQPPNKSQLQPNVSKHMTSPRTCYIWILQTSPSEKLKLNLDELSIAQYSEQLDHTVESFHHHSISLFNSNLPLLQTCQSSKQFIITVGSLYFRNLHQTTNSSLFSRMRHRPKRKWKWIKVFSFDCFTLVCSSCIFLQIYLILYTHINHFYFYNFGIFMSFNLTYTSIIFTLHILILINYLMVFTLIKYFGCFNSILNFTTLLLNCMKS